jgi:ornithine carbamoyltransferase
VILIMYARPNIRHRNLWSVQSLSPAEIRDVLDAARRLRLAGQTGQAGAPLRGRNLALLHETPPDHAADGLRSAAVGLGAQVSHLRPAEARISPVGADPATVRMLGRLYDAIDCESLPPALIADVAREAGVPVFNGLGHVRHPTRVLAELLAMQEHSGKALDALSVRFVGDPTSPCGEALLRVASPRDRWPPPELWEALKASAVARGERLHLFESPEQAGEDSDLTVDAANDPPWPLSRRGAGPVGHERTDYRQATLQAMLVAAIN